MKKDIFKNLMWYTMADSNAQYPLAIETVKRIKQQNREGIKPEELETVEVVSNKPKEVEPEYADLVGQISLRSLEKNSRKRKDKERSRQQPQNLNRRPDQKTSLQPGQQKGRKGHRSKAADQTVASKARKTGTTPTLTNGETSREINNK